jgi:quercetin dioxygenase-like cupin family protein
MNESEFKAALLQEGFDDIEVRTIAANVHNKEHAHAFDVRALLLAGELTLSAQGKHTTYRAGDIFTLAANCEHVEQFGAQGATYLVGRWHVRA